MASRWDLDLNGDKSPWLSALMEEEDGRMAIGLTTRFVWRRRCTSEGDGTNRARPQRRQLEVALATRGRTRLGKHAAQINADGSIRCLTTPKEHAETEKPLA
ncbi:hypothetical protein ACP70R_043758 [Stipagrostis hirtigluma subsp. patula]